MQKGLTTQLITQTAMELVERRGEPSLSMHELAATLGVKTPSLYNHISGIDSLLAEVCRRAVDEFKTAQLTAMSGKTGDEAVCAMACAYRAFARGRCGLYRAIMAIPAKNDEALTRIAAAVAEPAMLALSGYGLSQSAQMHWQRVLRSMLHGFAAQEQAGYFCHYPVSVDESFELMLGCFLSGLHAQIEHLN